MQNNQINTSQSSIINPQSSNNIAIKVKNLTKVYKLYEKPIDRLKESLNPFRRKYHREFYALKDVSFEVKKGETVGIIGRNGSGKSTLLKIITGVLKPSCGRVDIYGKISAILELGSGMNPEMNGIENIYLNSAINGLTKEEVNEKINNIIEFSELGDFIRQPIKMYSSGMRARLAFAIAINVEPDILIVDEALAVGDAAFQRKCFVKMEEIRKNGATILFVSHSAESIVSLCNRAIWLNNGEKIIEGKPKLVTGLYMKNSQKKQIDKANIIKEFEELKNQPENPKSNNNNDNSKLKIQNSTLSIQEYFNPTLKPKSTIYYEEKGAKISDVRITTLDGREVNVLVQGKEYVFVYKVELFDDFKQIHFGMHMKDRKGIILAGSVYPSKNKFIEQKAGNYILKFYFLNLFNMNEVYCSVGVKSVDGNFLHRIIDCYMFKTSNISSNGTGLINLIDKREIHDSISSYT